MRTNYKELLVQVIEFNAEDVITTSGVERPDYSGSEWDPF